jgi:alpha-glucosidase
MPQKIVFGFHDTAVGLLSILTQYLGRQRRLPDWIMDGAILGIGGGLDATDPDSLVTKLDRAQRADTKIAAVWAEDWTGLRHFKAQTRLFWNGSSAMNDIPPCRTILPTLKNKDTLSRVQQLLFNV